MAVLCCNVIQIHRVYSGVVCFCSVAKLSASGKVANIYFTKCLTKHYHLPVINKL